MALREIIDNPRSSRLMKNNGRQNRKPEDHEIGKYTMSVAVKLTGTHPQHIRRLGAAGLLNPDRTDGGQRLFSDSDIDIIKEVTQLETEGINLIGAKAILEIRKGKRT